MAHIICRYVIDLCAHRLLTWASKYSRTRVTTLFLSALYTQFGIDRNFTRRSVYDRETTAILHFCTVSNYRYTHSPHRLQHTISCSNSALVSHCSRGNISHCRPESSWAASYRSLSSLRSTLFFPNDLRTGRSAKTVWERDSWLTACGWEGVEYIGLSRRG